jgi:hypothetical protein
VTGGAAQWQFRHGCFVPPVGGGPRERVEPQVQCPKSGAVLAVTSIVTVNAAATRAGRETRAVTGYLELFDFLRLADAVVVQQKLRQTAQLHKTAVSRPVTSLRPNTGGLVSAPAQFQQGIRCGSERDRASEASAGSRVRLRSSSCTPSAAWPGRGCPPHHNQVDGPPRADPPAAAACCTTTGVHTNY